MTPENIVTDFEKFLASNAPVPVDGCTRRPARYWRVPVFGHFLRDLLRDFAFFAARARASTFPSTRFSAFESFITSDNMIHL